MVDRGEGDRDVNSQLTLIAKVLVVFSMAS